VWANGNRFEGNWINDKKDGNGQFEWHYGDIYTGTWKHN
tara:strand:- start:339 stop:455 length:117 start_codon:yes stop_codon:yes gene_type:complete